MNNEHSHDYRINVEAFEGPLDLLLYLIKKNDIQISDIPIAFILEEYIKYLDSLKEMNIDLAGEFLLMAAELAYIKSRMLLPEEGREEEDGEEDPRADLVNRLLEYQRYKDAAQALAERSILYRDVFTSQKTRADELSRPVCGPIESNVYELVDAFARIIIKLPKEQFHNVAVDRISVNERIIEITDLIRKDVMVCIEDLLEKPITRYCVVITFLALLEMARLKMIKLFQTDEKGGIYLRSAIEKIGEKEILRLIKSDTVTSDKPVVKEDEWNKVN